MNRLERVGAKTVICATLIAMGFVLYSCFP